MKKIIAVKKLDKPCRALAFVELSDGSMRKVMVGDVKVRRV